MPIAFPPPPLPPNPSLPSAGTTPRGFQGPVGSQGPQGIIGTQGVQGAQGFQGIAGAQGAQGPQGVAGSQGAQGPQGVAGSQGAQGPQGVAGTQGAQGVAGAQGAQGPTGTFSGTTALQTSFTNNTASTSITTGTVVITGGLGVSGSVYIGGNTSTDSSGQIKALDCSGYSVFRPIVEVMSTAVAVGSTYTHNWSSSAILDISGITANCTLSLTNIPFPNAAAVTDRAIVFTIILRQSAAPFYINALNINGVAATIRWPSATAPTPTASRVEIESLTLLYRGTTWTVMGQYTSFG